METKRWLFCDFHIHTDASDGALSMEAVVDLYGEHGFDVIAITDHILDITTIERQQQEGLPLMAVPEAVFQDQLHRLWREKKRAWSRYNMLLIPGAEITNNTGQYHLLALDIKEYISPDPPVRDIIDTIHEQEAIAIACHPHYKEEVDTQPVYAHLWDHHQEYKNLFDAWEVANRDSLFDVVGLRKFNYVANSDFHEMSHIYSWKTMLNCEKNTEAIKEALRANRDVGICLYRNLSPKK
jgi:3',5'-nucleoside bisphosphate phosphatase